MPLYCEDCGSVFAEPLVIKTTEQTRIVCPVCKESGPKMGEPDMAVRFNLEGDE